MSLLPNDPEMVSLPFLARASHSWVMTARSVFRSTTAQNGSSLIVAPLDNHQSSSEKQERENAGRDDCHPWDLLRDQW